MTFSVVMTVFETFPFLPRALSGLLQQDDDDWELILVSDGDVPAHGIGAPRPLLRRLRQRGVKQRLEFRESPRAAGCFGNRARRLGLQMAMGEYVLFVNHDNLIAPRCVAVHRENARHTPGCVSVAAIDYWKDDVYHGRFPRALQRSRIDLLNFALPRELALRIDAFGPAMERVYAADWLVFDAARALAPVQVSRELTGTHF